jgi:2-amino-4-hydroxy-6-hydroxymethyldihydropteridine diphosphokinase
MPDAYIALGSNLDDPARQLRAAAAALSALGEIAAASSLYETEPVGFRDQPAFLNAVLLLRTDLPPQALMRALLRIEQAQGRQRRQKDGPRTLDLDILFYGGAVIDEPGLRIPHPRLHERRFVLAPLAEIAPDLLHPTLNKPIRQLAGKLEDPAAVTRLETSANFFAPESSPES